MKEFDSNLGGFGDAKQGVMRNRGYVGGWIFQVMGFFMDSTMVEISIVHHHLGEICLKELFPMNLSEPKELYKKKYQRIIHQVNSLNV